MFLQVRDIATRKITKMTADLFPDLDEDDVRTLTACAVAGADGLFVHGEINGDAVDLVAMFELHAHLLFEEAARRAAGSR